MCYPAHLVVNFMMVSPSGSVGQVAYYRPGNWNVTSFVLPPTNQNFGVPRSSIDWSLKVSLSLCKDTRCADETMSVNKIRLCNDTPCAGGGLISIGL